MIYDAIVVGAGVIGTFHALALARTGKKVLLLERNNRQINSSVRNFGQVVPSGQELTTWRPLGIKSLEIYGELQKIKDVSALNRGSYYIASDEQEMQLLEEMAAIDKAMNYPSILMSAHELAGKFAALKTSYAKGGLYYPLEFSVEPHRFVNLVSAYTGELENVDYHKNVLVTGCDITDEKVKITTSCKKTFYGEKAIICTSYELKTLFPEILMSSGMEISKLHMMITREQAAKLPGNILTGYTIRRYEAFHSCPSYPLFNKTHKNPEIEKNGIHILFKQAADGRIIIGDSHHNSPAHSAEDADYHISSRVNELMLKEAREILELDTWEIDQYWLGYYMTHPNEIFEHTIEDRIHIVNGIGGKGMTCGGGYSFDHIARIYN